MKHLGLSLVAFVGITLFLGALALVPSVAVPAHAATVVSDLTDCPSASGVLSAAFNLPTSNAGYPLTVDYSNPVGNTFIFTVTTPTTDSGQGVIEYCVYPTDSSGIPTGTIPAGTTDSTTVVEAGHVWTAGFDCSSGCADSIRSDGNPANIPYDGATTTTLTVNWGSATNFLIVLHVLDGTICGGGTSNPGTCFVIPNGNFKFPPPPPRPVPEFPAGILAVMALAIPALMLARKLSVKPSI